MCCSSARLMCAWTAGEGPPVLAGEREPSCIQPHCEEQGESQLARGCGAALKCGCFRLPRCYHTLPLPFALGYSAQHSNNTFFFSFFLFFLESGDKHSLCSLCWPQTHSPPTSSSRYWDYSVSLHVWPQKHVLGYSFVETLGTAHRVSTRAARLADTELHPQPPFLLLKQGPM